MIEQVIEAMIYVRPLPDLLCGVYLNPETELHWLMPVMPIEPKDCRYERKRLDGNNWDLDGIVAQYNASLAFKADGDWGDAWGWFLSDLDGNVFYTRRFAEGPFEVKRGDSVEFLARFKL